VSSAGCVSYFFTHSLLRMQKQNASQAWWGCAACAHAAVPRHRRRRLKTVSSLVAGADRSGCLSPCSAAFWAQVN
jgi:hypothetical protein